MKIKIIITNDPYTLNSIQEVTKESKLYYYYLHSDFRGTYTFKEPKKNCEVVND